MDLKLLPYKSFRIGMGILLFCIIPNSIFSQNKDLVKLEWYHYIILSPVLVIDAVRKGYQSIGNKIDDFREYQSLPELHKAVISSDMAKIKILVSAGVNLEEKDKKGETALFYALDNNRINIARYLIENHADVNAVNYLGRLVVQPAIANNQFDLIKLMIRHNLNLEKTNGNGTILNIVCNRKQVNFKMVQLFVDNAVDINAKDKNQYSPLMYLTTKEEPNINIIQYMIKKGADVNAKDPTGRSILRLLVESRTLNLNLVKLLLENGADINSKDKEGHSIFDFIQTYYDYSETNEIVNYLNKYRNKKH
ncbi:ankyrin repeat domain-containing protein [Leptospira montravelensis]|uniref:Ankyrin repeat domain-containing protein n=1 Tax=Leptospira montravelensis TaxID=2484961 RepID=A0ABY2LVY2_9LEPT|nr:ankyrin repeat domain-containing protein [Leptospira montravelensis]TGK78176.1 ankyrin repeat domain-containing protein [Leptospira montravelensis]TGL03778.1 ankyrin repeat domain-containing protein [Leptospira montravelensis]